MKKSLYIIFTALFLVLSLVLSVGILFVGPSQAGANEQLSQQPVLFDEEGKRNDNYLSELAAWVNDHFYLRQELISINNLISATVFGTSGEDSVILGKDGWLYYGSTLDDYTGRNGMTDRELYSAARNLQLMAEYCRSQDREFAFMIAPNKNSLYAENMPDYGAVSQQHDAQKLMELLSGSDVTVIDLFSAFEAEDEVLYYATDSHWNQKGAALGADLINGAFGRESSYYTDDFVFAAGQRYKGDLYEMLYPAFAGVEKETVYAGTLDFTYTSQATKPDSITLLTEGKGEGTLLAYRDSFGNLLYPYLADSYASARFSRSTSYNLTLEGEDVLVELVERNLAYLITYVPVMPSPVRDIAAPADAVGAVKAENKPRASAPDGISLWTGTLQDQPDDRAHVYVVCNGQTYEAFLTRDNGYAVYLPEDAAPEAVLVQSGEILEKYAIN